MDKDQLCFQFLEKSSKTSFYDRDHITKYPSLRTTYTLVYIYKTATVFCIDLSSKDQDENRLISKSQITINRDVNFYLIISFDYFVSF